MTFQHDADGVPDEGTRPESGEGAEEDAGSSESNSTDESNGSGNGEGAAAAGSEEYSGSPQHGRALLALVAAGTVAVAPIADTVLGPAGGGDGAHSSPVFLLAEVSHDIGHNDWAFQGGLADRIIWVVTYIAIAVAWIGIAVWIRTRDRRAARAVEPRRPMTKLWLKVLGAAIGAQFAAGVLTIGAGLYAQWTATDFGPVALRLADVCSPWWSCVAALIVVARAERNAIVLRAAIAYGVVLAVVLLVPLPGPGDVKALILAATVAVPALLDRRVAAGVEADMESVGSGRPTVSEASASQLDTPQISAGQIKPGPTIRQDAAAAG
jgi:hypothetical protein